MSGRCPRVRRPVFPTVALAALTAVGGGGCAGHVVRLQPVRVAFQRGDLAEADRLLGEGIDRNADDADVLRLDRAVVALADGRPAEAERLLRGVRDRFDELEEPDASETGSSLLSDDGALAYSGADHEKVLIRGLLAVANLVQDGDDAEAYSLQVVEKQRSIVAQAGLPDGKNPKDSYRQVALAPYLRGILREATHRHYDDAARAYADVVAWEPEFAPGRLHLERAARGSHSTRGNGVVHVIALVGRGPFKADVAELPTSEALLVAGSLLSAGVPGGLTPTVAPIRVPRVVVAPGAAATVQVAVGDWSAGRTETITDVSRMALSQEEAMLPWVMGRAVARRAIKKGTIWGVKQGLGMHGGLPGAALDVAGIAWEATETADTRCWSLLPDRIQVLRLELPAGRHTLGLAALDRAGQPLGAPVERQIEVSDGRNTYLVVVATDSGILGRPPARGP
jgi:hypothetical protein